MTAQMHAMGRGFSGRVAIVAGVMALLTPLPVAWAALPEPAGWYAGDIHAHRSCGGSPAPLSTMLQLMSPHGLTLASVLADMGNGEVLDAPADLPNVRATDDPISTGTRVLHWDAEFHWDATYRQFQHQVLGGHLVVLGVTEAHQVWQEYTAPVFDWAHARGGIAGFAHMQYLDNAIPQTLNCCLPLEYPVEVALGKSDFISEDVVAGEKTVVTVTVDLTERHQVIQGFGVNFTGPYYRDDQAGMFDLLTKDLGVTMFRVVAYFVGSDWEVANDNADPHAANWAYYDERYSNPIFEASWKGLRALNARGIRPVLALMGPAPEWMVEATSPPPRHSVCSPSSTRGRLKPEMYDEFAETVVTMAVYARRKAGIQFDYFSPVNETDCYPAEGPRVDPEDMPALLDAIARRLKQEGLGDVKLVVADNAIITNDYISPVLNDAELMTKVGAFALHSYSDESVGPHVETVRQGPWSRTPVWLTEYGDLSDENATAENEWQSFALASTRRALLALNQGATALFYFNAFDDYEECMRRHTFYGLFTSAGHVYTPKKRYYAARQLFHFVAPGAERVGVRTDVQGLTLSAFRDAGAGTVSIVGVKQGGPNRVRVFVPQWKDVPSTWDVYLTTREHNCRKVTSLDADAGVVEFDLPDEAAFTLVGSGRH